MKLTPSLLGLAVAGLLFTVGAGCKKAEQAPPPVQQNGVTIDAHKLQAEFASSTSPEVRQNLQKFTMSLRYKSYMDAMMALDKIAADPSLTEPQKKLAADVMEQLKQANNAKESGAAPVAK